MVTRPTMTSARPKRWTSLPAIQAAIADPRANGIWVSPASSAE